MSAAKSIPAPSDNACAVTVDIIRQKRKSGSAAVIPFPVARRQHFISNAHVIAADMSDAEAADYFRAIVARHRERLEQIGVAPWRVDDDVAALRNYFFG